MARLGTYKKASLDAWYVRRKNPETGRRNWYHVPRQALPKTLRMSLLLLGIQP